MALISRMANHLMQHAEPLAVEVVEGVLHEMKLEIPEYEKERAITMYIELIGFLGESLVNREEEVPHSLIVWSKKNAEEQVSSGGKISEIVVRYPSTRKIFIEILTRMSVEFGLSIKETAFIIERINEILDISLNETVYAFEYLTDKKMDENRKELAELSAPLVPIKEGMAVLPFIGTIDFYKAEYILKNVVPKIAELQIEYLIADFSGILTLDNETIHYLYHIGDIVRLLGTNIVVTGLRPEIAVMVVNSGIDMSTFKTFSNVKQALEAIV